MASEGKHSTNEFRPPTISSPFQLSWKFLYSKMPWDPVFKKLVWLFISPSSAFISELGGGQQLEPTISARSHGQHGTRFLSMPLLIGIQGRESEQPKLLRFLCLDSPPSSPSHRY